MADHTLVAVTISRLPSPGAYVPVVMVRIFDVWLLVSLVWCSFLMFECWDWVDLPYSAIANRGYQTARSQIRPYDALEIATDLISTPLVFSRLLH